MDKQLLIDGDEAQLNQDLETKKAVTNGTSHAPPGGLGAGGDLYFFSGFSAVHRAVLGGKIGPVKSLLKQCSPTDIDCPDERGFTPLLYAVLTGAHDVAATLLKVSLVQLHIINYTYTLTHIGWGIS